MVDKEARLQAAVEKASLRLATLRFAIPHELQDEMSFAIREYVMAVAAKAVWRAKQPPQLET
ncbi:MAG: hypothetical protein E6J28_15065 [Chloroflexi bacterium]|nr:MAG: hypothetical protein E6J28_15065 [Chloroflexota bacterium]